MQLAEVLRIAVRESPVPQWRIAALANVHPTTLSRLLNGQRVFLHDPRVIAVAKVVGVKPEDAFAPDTEGETDDNP